MAYPLIILGAGASKDYIDLDEVPARFRAESLQPPDTNHLFDRRFEEFLRNHPEVNKLATYLSIKSQNTSLEKLLRAYLEAHDVNFANRNPKVIKQIISLRFYLAELFNRISADYYYVNSNYAKLIPELEQFQENAYFVNFNYDLLLEKSIDELDVNNIDSYINNTSRMKILKIHGACNWTFSKEVDITGSYSNAQKYFAENADTFLTFFDGIDPIAGFLPNNYLVHQGEDRFKAYMPALAFPLDKKSFHVCPKTHVEDFIRECPNFDRVIIIGWRGADDYFSELLAKNLRDKIPTLVIRSNDPKTADDIRERYSKIEKLNIQDRHIYSHPKGFSSFMREDGFAKFLKDDFFNN